MSRPEMIYSAEETVKILVEAARNDASLPAMKLIAQLLGVPACDDCGYRKTGCRCVKEQRMNSKQVIVVRKDLNMRKGKMISQGAHSSMAWMSALIKHHNDPDREHPDSLIQLTPVQSEWINGLFTKIVVQVGSEAELMQIHDAAIAAGLDTHLITDAGLTEFKGVPTRTCLAIGPDEAEKIDAITRHLSLL